MNLFEMFETNKTLETQGVWVQMGDARLKVAAKGSQAYADLLEKKMAPYKHIAQQGLLQNKEIDRILTEVMAETILLDWENITDKDNNPIPYTKGNAIDLMNRLPKFRDAVMGFATDAALYKAKQDEDIAKN